MKARSHGFTLLEVLVVLSLLGVLLSLIAGAILGANRAMAKAERYSMRLDEVRASQNFLRTAFGQALPLAAGTAPSALHGPPSEAIFTGDGQHMRFYAPLSPSLGGGVYRHSLALVGQRLQLTLERLQGQFLQPHGEPQVLLDRVQALQLSYRGLTPQGQPTGWLDNWPWPGRLPRGVRIDARLDGPVPWPLQSVSLRLDLSGEADAL
jgi:general secretion pathway protein J